MEQDTDGRAVRVTPEPVVMESTPATLIVTLGGHTHTGPVTIVHPAGVTPPETVTHHCGPACERP